MATIISDNFNRVDGPLGNADTGQAWNVTTGNWNIYSSEARSVAPAAFGSALAVIESGVTDGITQVELVNPSTYSIYSSVTQVVFRYFSSAYYWNYGFLKTGSVYRLYLGGKKAGVAFSPWNVDLTAADVPNGSTIAVSYCGNAFEMFLNGVSKGTYTNTGIYPSAFYGTQCGISAYSGTVPVGVYQNVDDFLVTTMSGCPTSVSYNCTGGACVDPGTGAGTYATLAACLAGCAVAVSYNCTNGECVDPGDGSGAYANLAACLASGCGSAERELLTVNFDEGTGNYYYVVPPIVDSGEELRSKVLKAPRVTSKRTNQSIQVYPYDVDDEISTTDLENGDNSAVTALLDDNTNISQSPRQQVNCPNAVLSTVRVQGDDTGETTRDRIDEIVVELAEQGVRR